MIIGAVQGLGQSSLRNGIAGGRLEFFHAGTNGPPPATSHLTKRYWQVQILKSGGGSLHCGRKAIIPYPPSCGKRKG